jgi:hypothetical protein
MRPDNWRELGEDEIVEFDVHCELHTTLKSGGFLFSLQRLNLHNRLTSNWLCSD